MKEELQLKMNISPEQAVKILKEHGTLISLEQAKIILAFMYKLGKLSVDQYIKI